jgi:phospholipase/carboxylesterase
MTYQFAETVGNADSPLIFTFHGTGGTSQQFHGFASALMPTAHVISPAGDVNEGGAARYFRRAAEGVYDMADLAQRTEAMRTFMQSHVARLNPSKVIVLGYSNGANIAASVMLSGTRIVDKAVLLHPLIPWTPAPQPSLQGVDVLVTAGRRDSICPAPQTQAFADYLIGQSASLKMKWHDGGHEISQEEIDAITDFVVF